MIWAMDVRFFRNNPQFRFYRESKLDFVTDYYFFLKLLTYGHKNRVINKYVKDDKPNAKGGEQSKRTMEIFNRSVRKLEGMFPNVVSTYKKEGKNNWEDGFLGMRIQAAKAYKESLKCK